MLEDTHVAVCVCVKKRNAYGAVQMDGFKPTRKFGTAHSFTPWSRGDCSKATQTLITMLENQASVSLASSASPSLLYIAGLGEGGVRQVPCQQKSAEIPGQGLPKWLRPDFDSLENNEDRFHHLWWAKHVDGYQLIKVCSSH